MNALRPPRLTRLAAGLLAMASVLGGAAGWHRVCTQPLDMSGTALAAAGAPGERQTAETVAKYVDSLTAPIKRRDGIAFELHAHFAHTLDVAGCSPAASGLQWLKAAAHARSAAEAEEATTGLTRAVTRSASREELRATLCAILSRAPTKPPQIVALTGAGLTCEALPGMERR